MNKNRPIAHFINRITFGLYRLLRSHRASGATTQGVSPIWITGLFRSGTTLTARILAELGVDFGPEKHLLQAKGERKQLNPGGFYENYLFMDWSLKVFQDLKSWGDRPPAPEHVANYSMTTSDVDFARYSLVDVHDDRISNWNKLSVLCAYSPNQFEAYIADCFTAPFAVKNPHFSLLYPLLLKRWKQSIFVVVFRNPDDAIAAAKSITPSANYALYHAYYSRLLQEDQAHVIYFSFDALLEQPEASIEALAKALEIPQEKVQDAVKLVQPFRVRHRSTEGSDWPGEISSLYNEMTRKAINCS